MEKEQKQAITELADLLHQLNLNELEYEANGIRIRVAGEKANKVQEVKVPVQQEVVKEKKSLPFIYITCGLSDPLYEANADLRKQMDFLHIPYVYEEWAGGHEWPFWDKSIQMFIKFITE